MSEEGWSPSEAERAIMGAFHVATETTNRINRAQGRLHMAMLQVEELGRPPKLWRLLVELGEEIGLPESTWGGGA